MIHARVSGKLSGLLFLVSGWVTGLALQMDWFTRRWDPTWETLLEFATDRAWARYDMTLRLIVTPLLMVLVFVGFRALLRFGVKRILGLPRGRNGYRGPDNWPYAVFLLLFLGAFGFYLAPFLLVLLFAVGQGWLIRSLVRRRVESSDAAVGDSGRVMTLFFASGLAALVYQVVWQRALFQAFGVNIESVTVIVAVFMFGLGLGSLMGGALSRKFPRHLLQLFVACEFAIGVFGLFSLALIRQVSSATLGQSLPVVTAVTFALLCVPTVFMGATLPILVTYLHRGFRNVGTSLSLLYFINTLGSAVASFLCVNLFFVYLGLPGATRVAVLCNFGVAYFGYRLIRAGGPRAAQPNRVQPAVGAGQAGPGEAYRWILLVSFAVGFLSLSMEILWIRILSLATGGRPSVFGNLVGFYLVGIAAGAYLAKRPCQGERRRLPGLMARLLMAAAGFFYLVVSIAAAGMGAVGVAAIPLFYFGACGVALLTGCVFPILAHFAVTRSEHVGLPISGIYFANILGATAGPLLTGFYLLEWFSLERNVLHFALLTLALGLILALPARKSVPVSRRFVVGAAVAAMLGVLAFPLLYGRMVEKLYFKHEYRSDRSFRYLIQNRSGIIAAIPRPGGGDIMMGGGVYDGHFSIDLADDANKIRRAYMVPALHANPRRVLEIGLSTGSWARVLLNHEALESLDIVEINPGYLELIDKYEDQRSVLSDPRVRIFITDGRRWLLRHPEERYDVIVMNTTFYWRSQTNNLLSRQFLELLRRHLLPEGVVYFNTTSSSDAYFTAANVFPYIVQFESFLACSNSPFSNDPRERLERLSGFRFRGAPILDWDDGSRRAVVKTLAQSDARDRRADLLQLGELAQMITDDNLASEFKSGRKFYSPPRSWFDLLLLWAGGG